MTEAEEIKRLSHIEIRARALVTSVVQRWTAQEIRALDLNFSDRFFELQEEIAQFNSDKAKSALDAWERKEW